MKLLNFLILLLCFTTATTYSQKRMVFKDLPEYFNHAEKTGVNKEKILILSKEDNDALGEDIGTAGFFTFYGIVYNSELISAGSLESKSCWGQFRTLCKSVGSGSNGVKVDDISYLKNISFEKDKKTVIFLYSYQLGKRGVKNFIKPILEEIEGDSDFDYILLSLDITNIKS